MYTIKIRYRNSSHRKGRVYIWRLEWGEHLIQAGYAYTRQLAFSAAFNYGVKRQG